MAKKLTTKRFEEADIQEWKKAAKKTSGGDLTKFMENILNKESNRINNTPHHRRLIKK